MEKGGEGVDINGGRLSGKWRQRWEQKRLAGKFWAKVGQMAGKGEVDRQKGANKKEKYARPREKAG